MADISSTLDMIDNAVGQASPAAPASSADKTINLLQAGIDGKIKPTEAPYETTAKSLTLNAESGANSALASTLGAPVDVATWALNKGIHGINAAAEAAGLTHRNLSDVVTGSGPKPLINDIKNPVGGSESIKGAMGLIHANPDNVVPQNEAERIAHGIGEGAGSAVLLPLGGEALAAGKIISPGAATTVRSAVGAPDVLNATIGGAAGAGSTIAADVVPEPYKPLAATVGGLVGGLPVVAAHTAATGAKAAMDGLISHVTEQGAKRAVGHEMAAAATDQAVARENLATQPHEIVPGSTGTTGQIAGDTGLLNWERGVRQNNAAEFNDREAAQNTARVAHLESVQPTGNAADLPGVIHSQRDATAKAAETNTGVVDALSGKSVANAEVGQKSAIEGLKTLGPDASPAEVSGHFRNVRDALEADHETAMAVAAHKAEQARLASAPNVSSPEQVGQNLRAPIQEARNAAKAEESSLWKAVDPDGTLSVSMEPIQAAKNAVYGKLTKAGEADLSPKERSLADVIGQYRPVESFKELTDLRSSVSSAMREELRASGRTPAYARMSQLRSGIENAIDSAVEGRAVQEHGAVARGHMSIEDTMTDRIRKVANGGDVAAPVETKPSLLQFLASKGGLGPDAELDAIGAHSHTVNVDGVGRRKLVRQGGWPLDYAREAAEEAGYLRGDHNGTSTVNDLLDAVDAEMRGKKLYPEGFEGSVSKREAVANKEREDHEHDAFLRGFESDLADAGHGQLGSDVKSRAVNLMANKGMDPDAAVESALRQMDHEEGHAQIYGGPALENGLPSGRGSSESGAEGSQTEGPGARASSTRMEEQGVPDEEAGQRLRAASAATIQRAQTFDQGATGKLLKPGARAGEYKLSDANAASAIFHPGDTGGEDVRAYVKAVGPEKANTALSDAAAASLHEKATRPDGTLDPKKVDSWLAAHKTAIGELPPGTRTKFENAANAQRAVEDAFAARRDAMNAHDKSEAGKIMGLKDDGDVVREVGSIISSKDGAKRMGELAQAAKDNPAAKEGLQRAVVEHVMNKFLPDNLEKAQSFIKDKADVLGKVFTPEQIDGISKKIETAQTAGSKLESAKANRETALKEAQASEKEALSRYDQTVLGKIMMTEGTANVLDKLGTVFGSSDSAKQMGLLAEEAAKVKGGTDALRKAVTEMIRRDYSGSAEVGTSGEKGLSRAALDKFMKENTDTLEKVLSPDQVGKLKAIVDDQLRANRSITATKLKGGSDTAQNQIATKGGSILSLLAKQATEVGGTVIGSILGGPGGAVVGNIGAKASAALRDAGLNRLSEIRIRAALDPQFGKALLDEVPKYPDRNAAALIALRARQLSVAGVSAGARQQ